MSRVANALRCVRLGRYLTKPLTINVSLPETKAVESVCPYCGVGCAITYHVKDNKIVQVSGRESPVNHGRLCVKGRYGFDYAFHPQRLTVPLIRRPEFYPRRAVLKRCTR